MFPKPGDLFLKRYRLQRLLGVGGLGSVWKAVDTGRSEESFVAIKFLLQDQNLPPTSSVRFRQEARILARLSHPGIPKIYSIGDGTEGVEYFVFEYIDGCTLREVIRKGTGVLEALRIGVSLVEILEVIHQQGIVHRDLKPENLLLTRSDSCLKLIDFGISRTEHDALLRTRTGAILGTVQYMPPEQMASGTYTERSDLYAAGLVLYELLSGKPPFPDSESFLTLMTLKQSGRIDPLHGLASDLPPMVDVLLGRVLAADPEERPANAGEFKSELLKLVETVEALASGAKPQRTEELLTLEASESRGAGLPEKPDRTLITTGREADICSAEAQPRPRKTGSARLRMKVKESAKPLLDPSRWVVRLLAALGVMAVVVWKTIPCERENRGVASPILSRPPIVDSPRAPLRDQARSLVRRLQKYRAFLDVGWLRRFATERSGELRKNRKSVELALKRHCDDLGVTRPLESFLSRSREYFSDTTISESERFSTRSWLCDAELIELFCAEHTLESPFGASIGGCAGVWDDPVDVTKLSLARAISFVKYQAGLYGPALLARVLDDSWSIPKAARGFDRGLLWYAVVHWTQGMVLDVEVGPRFRRLVRLRLPQEPQPSLTLPTHEYRGPYGLQWNLPVSLLQAVENDGHRYYVGVWLPRVALTSRMLLRTRVIDLPMSSTGRSDPWLSDRLLSVWPAGL